MKKVILFIVLTLNIISLNHCYYGNPIPAMKKEYWRNERKKIEKRKARMDRRARYKALVKSRKEYLQSRTDLMEAAKRGDIEKVKLLISKGVQINRRNNAGETALHEAYYGHKEIVLLLIENGVMVNMKDKKGRTALHLAIKWNRVKIVRLLIKKGAKVNSKDIKGRTALHYAAYHGRSKIVVILINNGAIVNLRDKKGKTALYFAGSQGHKKVVQILRGC